MTPRCFTYEDFVKFVKKRVEWREFDAVEFKNPKIDRVAIRDRSTLNWVYWDLYKFVLGHPQENPGRILLKWEKRIENFYNLSTGSEKLERFFFTAMMELKDITEEIWEGYRE